MNTPTVKSAERTLDVLEFVGRHANAASHGEIASGLGIPKGSLTKLLVNLRARAYLVLDAATGSHRLGPALFALVAQGRVETDVATLALPILRWITDTTREASSFTALRKDHMERVCGVDSEQPLSYRMSNHARFALHASSGGKAVLSVLPEAELQRYLQAAPLARLTPDTVHSPEALRAQLARIRKDGVAVVRNEQTVGVFAVAVPIRPPGGPPIGALTIVVPDARHTPALEALCKKTLKTAAVRLEQGLRMAAELPAAGAGAGAV